MHHCIVCNVTKDDHVDPSRASSNVLTERLQLLERLVREFGMPMPTLTPTQAQQRSVCTLRITGGCARVRACMFVCWAGLCRMCCAVCAKCVCNAVCFYLTPSFLLTTHSQSGTQESTKQKKRDAKAQTLDIPAIMNLVIPALSNR